MIGIYVRQSIFKKDSLSTEQQIEFCLPMCANQEYEVFEDLGYSGKNLKRPAFEAMFQKVRTGQIHKILVYKLDRISRNISDFSGLLTELNECSCEFISVSENFDTSTPIGRAMIYICMVFAQMERESVSQRVHDNYYYRTELGFWGGGRAPYGYQLKRMKYKGKLHTVLEPDPDTAPIVRQIYNWYLEPNYSVSTILEKLNLELKLTSRDGSLWTSRVIVDILTRPLYAPNDMAMYNYLTRAGATISNPVEDFDGKASIDLYGKKKGDASKHKRCRDISDMYCNVSSHDAIIDSDTWIKVQHKKKSLLRVPARAGTGKNSYFTGLMKCGSCGSGVSWTNSRGSQGYYLCSTKKNRGYNTCEQPLRSKKKTDPIIIDDIIAHYTSPNTLEKLESVKVSNKATNPTEQKERNILLIKLANIENEISNLLTSIQTGNAVLIKYINEKIVELDTEKNEINAELLKLDGQNIIEDSEIAIINKIRSIINEIPDTLRNGTFDEIKDLCHTLVNKITFQEDDSIDIEYTL